jgi:hypothetical protein
MLLARTIKQIQCILLSVWSTSCASCFVLPVFNWLYFYNVYTEIGNLVHVSSLFFMLTYHTGDKINGTLIVAHFGILKTIYSFMLFIVSTCPQISFSLTLYSNKGDNSNSFLFSDYVQYVQYIYNKIQPTEIPYMKCFLLYCCNGLLS